MDGQTRCPQAGTKRNYGPLTYTTYILLHLGLSTICTPKRRINADTATDNLSTLWLLPHLLSGMGDDPMGPQARGAFYPLRLPPPHGLPRGLSRLTALGLMVSEPKDLEVRR